MNERLLQGDLFWVYCGFLMNCKGDRDYSHMAGPSVESVLSLSCLDTSWKAPLCPWNKNKKQLVWVVSVEVYQTFLFLCHFETLWSCTEDRSLTESQVYTESPCLSGKKVSCYYMSIRPLVQLCDTCNSWDCWYHIKVHRIYTTFVSSVQRLTVRSKPPAGMR